MIKTESLFQIGIGTWGIGGLDTRNPDNNDEGQIEGIAYALQNGENFIEANLWYADGYSAKLTAEALKRSGINRENIFLSQTVYTQSAPNLDSARLEWKKFTDLFETDYVDTFQFSIKNFLTYGKEKSIEMLTELMENKKTRFVSITNADLKTLKWFYSIFKNKMFSHELIHNFEIRASQESGAIDFANDNEIRNVIAQPLRRNRTANLKWELLNKLAQKYNRTQNQIVINWLIKMGFLVIIKSTNKGHIDENLGAVNFEIERADLKLINDFKVPNFSPPETDWYWTSKGVPAHMLPNVFDEEYAKSKEN